MLVFDSQMHVVTFVFLILEFFMFLYQLGHYLVLPDDTSRFWYLILIVLLMFYNLAGGLFPDPKIGIGLVYQNIIAYGSGFLMASYFPFFFYRGLNLSRLRFHALYGVPLFLILPYLVFFVVFHVLTGDLEGAIRYGLVVPFVYSIVILWAILDAIRLRFREQSDGWHYVSRWEAMAVYLAVTPWVCMTAFAYFHVQQWIEALCTNLGFVLLTGIFIARSIRRTKLKLSKLDGQLLTPSEAVFEKNLVAYPYTAREIDVIRLLRQGHSNKDIADKLFIAPTTVARHVQNIYYKTDVKNRIELMRRLEME